MVRHWYSLCTSADGPHSLLLHFRAANFPPHYNLAMTPQPQPATQPVPKEAPAIPGELDRGHLLEIYRYLRLTRTLEERLVALFRQSKVIGGLFRSLGQEGESVASAYALERGHHRDVLSPLIRNLGSMLVMGAKPV